MTAALAERPQSVMRRLGGSARRERRLSLTAAASVYSRESGNPPRRKTSSTTSWQDQAWQYFDDVGELRFSCGWLANTLSRVNLVAAAVPQQEGDEPRILTEPDPDDPDENAEPLTEAQAFAIAAVREIAGGISQQGALMGACATHLTVPGIVWIVVTADETTDSYVSWDVVGDEEVKRQNGRVTWTNVDGEPQEFDKERGDLLIKVWRQHPRKRSEPDSPVRAALPVLRIIDRMTIRQNVNIDSRAAGNGLLLMPDDVEFPALPDIPGRPDASDLDKFMFLLGTVMSQGILDPASPSARVPIGVMLPGEFIDKVKHLTFDSQLDNRADAIMNLAIRRLAMAMEFPPEVLLGVSDVNHWNAWQIQEEAVTLQVEPLSETIVYGLTKGWLRSRMAAAGFPVEDQNSVMVWYDTTDLTTRPDLGDRAKAAYDAITITREAYLREAGLDDGDALDVESDEFRRRVLLDVLTKQPSLAPEILPLLGIVDPATAEAMAETLTPPAPPPAADTAPAADEPAQGPPEQSESTVGEPSAAANRAALLAACDALVDRALERVGNRLRAALSKGRAGGSAATECVDPTALHCQVEAVDHLTLGAMLDGAFPRIPVVAARYGIDAQHLSSVLNGYTRTLILARTPHTIEALADALDIAQPAAA